MHTVNEDAVGPEEGGKKICFPIKSFFLGNIFLEKKPELR
jgi:hypothetical protein